MPIDPRNPIAPIPGENYTSDTKNYAWHRPPEITDLDKAIEVSIKQLTEKNAAYQLLTVLQAGVSVVQATDMFVTAGIGAGKWTPDFAILLAGPVSHMMKLMAEGYGIKYQMGLEDKPMPTIAFLKAQNQISLGRKEAWEAGQKVVAKTEEIKDKAAAQAPGSGGFMGEGSTEAATDVGAMPEQGMEEPMPPMGKGFMG
jgi:hypothetical protein